MKFHTTILPGDKTATGIRIPDEVVESLGSGKRPPIRVTINGYTYRNTVAVMGGVYMVGVSAEHRAGAGVAGGDEVDVEIELDTAPREVTVPDDFAATRRRVEGARDVRQAVEQQQGLARAAGHRSQDRRDAAAARLRTTGGETPPPPVTTLDLNRTAPMGAREFSRLSASPGDGGGGRRRRERGHRRTSRGAGLSLRPGLLLCAA